MDETRFPAWMNDKSRERIILSLKKARMNEKKKWWTKRMKQNFEQEWMNEWMVKVLNKMDETRFRAWMNDKSHERIILSFKKARMNEW